MKKERIISFLLFLYLFLFVILSPQVYAERNIFVGDLINIKVTTEEFTEDEIREKFKDFEIVKLKNENHEYLITLRSFETGKKTIQLGNKEIEIIVKSTLDEIERKEVFEGDLTVEKARYSFNFKYVLYIFIVIFFVTLVINLLRLLKRKKTMSLSTYQHFINETNNIDLNDEDSFVKMTLSFKRYIEWSYSCTIKGKTSTEIISEIKDITSLQVNLSDIKAWLELCDYYKFTGVTPSTEDKQELLGKLVEVVEKIKAEKEVEV